ncbi:phage Gp37/Gp68 family protein [Labrenzia sp. DG1229]|uniref:phage Gp37/Gp68 family protein n=1 Tax=Labrenzia sp. DG1229 TaxID=681847 RepID=UPI000491CB79|nr:phage Gp37/Gp68 family protein [Labrenzia sp. DG1229]
MAQKTDIEWTDNTWNPVRGCSRVSEGCRNCYAEIMAARFSGPGQWGEGLAEIVRKPDGAIDHRWTGKLIAAPEHVLLAPLKWKKPRLVFVNSTSDLFHENVPDDLIDRVFAVMALTPHITYQVLTKRPERMRTYLTTPLRQHHIVNAQVQLPSPAPPRGIWPHLPLPNVWFGVSIEDQVTADTRVRYLIDTPAAIRFVSVEPLLASVDLSPWLVFLNWVICGGESGPDARPLHPDWARQLRDQCAELEVPFFFKQWGAWLPLGQSGFTRWQAVPRKGGRWLGRAYFNDGNGGPETHDSGVVETEQVLTIRESSAKLCVRLGKKRAGRELDGVLHDGFPSVRKAA